MKENKNNSAEGQSAGDKVDNGPIDYLKVFWVVFLKSGGVQRYNRTMPERTIAIS